MNNSSNEGQILVNALMQNENLLSKLYAKYANNFAIENEFWAHISHDETDHASWLHSLTQKINQGWVHMAGDRFKLEAIEYFADYIKTQISTAEQTELSLIQALSVSMDMENSMLENGTFKVYETDSTELKDVLNKLQKSTEIHHKQVKERWLSERSKADIA